MPLVVPTFDSLGLKDDLLRGVYAYSKLHQILVLLSNG